MTAPDTLFDSLARSWLLSVRARNLSPKTCALYEQATIMFRRFLTDKYPGVQPDGLRREHIETYLTWYSEGRAPATVRLAFRVLQIWMAWLLEEGEIDADPTVRMVAPAVPEKAVPVLTDDQLRALLAVCDGRSLVARRDTALIRLLIDTGGRLGEIGNLMVDEVDLAEQTCSVMGKGRRPRVLPFGVRTAAALDRYLRVRAADRAAAFPHLWLGERGRGPIAANGVYQVVKRRGREAGLDRLHPHQFRHTAAHRWLADGGSEGDLMQLAGWRSRAMLDRYASSAAAGRAREAHRRMGLGDRI